MHAISYDNVITEAAVWAQLTRFQLKKSCILELNKQIKLICEHKHTQLNIFVISDFNPDLFYPKTIIINSTIHFPI